MARRRTNNLFNNENNILRGNLLEEEEEAMATRNRTTEEEEATASRENTNTREEENIASRRDTAFREDRRPRSRRDRAPSRIPVPVRRTRVIDGTLRSIRQNHDPTFTEQDVPNQLPGETHENSNISGDYVFERQRRRREEQANPISARFYRRGDLTDAQFEQQGFSRLKSGMKVVDNINEATYVEHILPDGSIEYHPAGCFEEDPNNPDNLLTAQKISDESEIDDEDAQSRRNMLRTGGRYRFLYIQGGNRNVKYGGDFKYHLREEIPFSLSYLGIYKKSEEDLLEKEEIDTNCFVEAFKEYPKEYDILKNNYLNTYTECDANTINPICEMIKKNIHVKYFSFSQNQVRPYTFPSPKSGIKYKNTITICLFEDHFFPFIEETEFKTDYIKQCLWKTGRTPRGRNLNSFNLVKETCLRKEIYYAEKTKDDIKNKRKKKEVIKEPPKDFPDYVRFSKKDSREIKKFDIKRFGVKPITDPLDPEFNISELDKNGYLTEELTDEIINCREKPLREEYIKTIPSNVLEKMLGCFPDDLSEETLKIKILISNYLEENFSNSLIPSNELEELAGSLEEKETSPEEDYEKYFDELESLPYLEEDSYFDTEAIYTADVETATDGTKHVAYIICWDRLGGMDKGEAYGADCCKKFINHLKKQKEKKITVMFQNFAYDANFVIRHLTTVSKSIEPSKNKNYKTDGIIFSANGRLKKISFVDQLPKIPMALSKYEKMFNLEKGKFKDFPYWFCNLNTIFLRTVTAHKSLYSKLVKIFPEKYIKYSEDGEKIIIRHIDYALDYCHQDVKTQREGWNVMWQQVKDETGLDYNKILTLSGLAKAVCLKEGCYEGVHEIRGKTGAFIRKCVVGGRVMPALHDKENPGIHILNEEEAEEYQNGFNYNYPDDEIKSEEKYGEFVFKRGGDVNIFLNEEVEQKEKVQTKIRKDPLPKSRTSSKFISPRPRLKAWKEKDKICLFGC